MNSLIAAEPPRHLWWRSGRDAKTLVGGGGAGRELWIIHSVRDAVKVHTPAAC